MSGRRPLTYDDFWDFRVVGEVQVSPDGKRAAYVVTTLDRVADEERSSIWVVDLESGDARPFTSGTKRDTQPRWSPDGRWLAFVSTRDADTSQIYLMPTEGGEATRLTSGDDPADGPVWSPDGQWIAFVVRARSNRQGVASEIEWAAEREERRDVGQLRRLTDVKYRYDGRGYLDSRSHLFVMDREGGVARQLTDGDFDDTEPAWSPDGRTIAFVSNRTERRHVNFASDIWTLEVETGELRKLNSGTLTAVSPAWSPDGGTVAFYAQREWVEHGTLNRHVWAVSREGGDERDLTPGFDPSHGMLLGDYGGTVSSPPVWSPDGASIYFTASDEGSETVCRTSLDGGVVERVSCGPIDVEALQLAGGVLICTASTPTRPFDIARIPLDGGEPVYVTEMNRLLLDDVWIGAPERMTYTSVDGWEVEGWLLLPETHDAPCPLVLIVHGGPHSMYGNTFYFNMQVLAGHGIACLYINPRGSSGYGLEFLQAVHGDWGGKDFQDLMNGVDAVLARGHIDSRRMGITGGSYGGFMTNWAVGHTDRFRCGVAINALSNLVSFWGTSDIGSLWLRDQIGGEFWEMPDVYARLSPLTYVQDVRTPLLLLHAENDYRVPIEQSEQMFAALKILGCEVELIRIPDASHGLGVARHARHRLARWRLAKEWFDRYLALPAPD